MSDKMNDKEMQLKKNISAINETEIKDIPINPPGKSENHSICRYAAKIFVLAYSICEDGNHVYEKTRSFENLAREQLVTSTFIHPTDVPSSGLLNEFISAGEREADSLCIKDAIQPGPGAQYLFLALGILNKENKSFDFSKDYNKWIKLFVKDDSIQISVSNPSGDSTHNQYIRYVAFYVLSTYLRRQKYTQALNSLHKKYLYEFKKFPSSEHLRLESISAEDLTRKNIDEAEKLCSDMPEQYGVKMMYGDLVTKFCEKNPDWANSNAGKKHLEQAYIEIEDAIRAERNYPKPQMIKAKILMWQNRFEEALDAIREGIECQNLHHRDEGDHQSRLAEFYEIQFTVKNKQQEASFRENISALEDELKNRDIKSLEILGLFTAVITLMIGVLGNGIAADSSLIFQLFGCVIITFTVFHFLLNTRLKKKMTRWIPFLVSLGVGALMFLVA